MRRLLDWLVSLADKRGQVIGPCFFTVNEDELREAKVELLQTDVLKDHLDVVANLIMEDLPESPVGL